MNNGLPVKSKISTFYHCAKGIEYKKSKNSMEEKMKQEDRFIVSVKVGPKGQITIPVEARKMFDIKEGDTLMVLGDKKRGIALVKDDAFYRLLEDQ